MPIAVEKLPEFEHKHTRTPVCPHCGHQVSDHWELFREGQEDVTTECGECEREFICTQHVHVSYSTIVP